MQFKPINNTLNFKKDKFSLSILMKDIIGCNNTEEYISKT